jgi:enoyl-CoA hydratase
MVDAMTERLKAWRNDRDIEMVIVRGVGEKAFCAGGDIRALYDSGKAGTPYVIDFYAREYRLNTLIKRFPKPYIALVNGIVMGGGVGVSVHGSVRVCGEGTMFAMPETGIGLFPDVGGTYFLPRCPGETGMYLALTGARLDVTDARYAGIATHVVPQAQHVDLLDALCNGADPLEKVLARYAVFATDKPRLEGLRTAIDSHFSKGSVDDIFASLQAGNSLFEEQTLKTLKAKSPTSLKVAFRQVREGARACARSSSTRTTHPNGTRPRSTRSARRTWSVTSPRWKAATSTSDNWHDKGVQAHEDRFHWSGKHGGAHGREPCEGGACRDSL